MKTRRIVREVFVESNINAAWAAGLFDGEGSTTLLKAQRDKYAYVRMNVPQKLREVLDKFLSIVQVGKIYKHKTREMHSLDIYKQEDVENTLNLLWPYLSEVKKKQALLAFERKENYNRSS
jgi:LAGLIDADG endonuclease